MASIRQVATDVVARAVTFLLARSGDRVAQLFTSREDPWPIYAAMRDEGPVYRSRLGGMVAVTSQQLCARVLSSSEFGFRDPAGRLHEYQRFPFGQEPSLLEVDPPDHTRLRRIVAPLFKSKVLDRCRPCVEQTATRLLDAIERAGGTFDMMTEFAVPLPIMVINDLLGIPVDRHDDVARYGTAAVRALDGPVPSSEAAKVSAAVSELTKVFTTLAHQRKVDPRDDVVTALVQAHERDDITFGEVIATCHLLFVAGFVNTVHLLGNGMHRFALNPDQWELLREKPDLVDRAVEEILRFDTPVPVVARVSQTEVELAGHKIQPNTMTLTMLAAANRDPRVYTDPDEFDITRTVAHESLALGRGVHYCLGAYLARIEGEVALRAVSERMPDIRLDGKPTLRPSRPVRGFLHLPMRAAHPGPVPGARRRNRAGEG